MRKICVQVCATAFAAVVASAGAAAASDGWTGTDVGAPGAVGSAAVLGAGVTMAGAGLDIWGTSDQFHFASVTLTGDGSIAARVTSLQHVNAWTKAGVMMRGTRAADAPHAFMLVSPAKGLAFQRRVTPGGLSSHTSGGAGVAPAWVKLTRAGDVFTAARSADGLNWTVVGAQTIAMGASIEVGLAVSSHVTGVLATAAFEEVSVTDGAGHPLASAWATGDVGATGAAGTTAAAPTRVRVTGAGLDVWGTADHFQFDAVTLTGDGSIVTRVAAVENVNAWTKAGVMMRESLASDAKHAFMLISAGKGLAFQRRPVAGGTSLHTSGGPGVPAHWLKLARSGDLFTASRSYDGVTWTTVGTQTIAMAPTIHVGLAVSSHVTGVLASAVFEWTKVEAAAPAPAPEPIEVVAEPAPAPAPEPEPVFETAGGELRVLTWNVRHGGTRADGVYDPANTVDWILKMNPQVASLNEFDNATQAAKIVSLLESRSGRDWDYHYDRGNMLVTTLPVTEKDICVVNSSVGRKATFMTVLANGRTVSVYSTHLSLTQSERVAEVKALKACATNKVEGRILAGDFNMQAGSTEYVQATTGYTDAWKVAKSLGTATNYSGNCDGCTKNSRIDYVFTSTGATALVQPAARIYDTRNASGVMASDHKPLLVTYTIK